MRKFRYVGSLLITSMLAMSFANQGFAAEQDRAVSQADREELSLEFKDSGEAAWAIRSIGKMKSQNVLSGYEDGSFRPNQSVSRVEAVVTAVRLMGLEEEAKAKPADARLHFKDASLIDKNYRWAKGYILVALEQGLFDTSEDELEPNEPASRVWVASLLVKALGLQTEALSQMTTVPNFQDASAIPAGAIGYVNVAVEQGIVSGYPDETFKPNRNVTRAEMATLLVNTNDNLLEQEGAVVVIGTITAIDFNNGNTVTGEAYGNVTTNGTITTNSFNGDSSTYNISSALAVPFYDRFIPASQLQVGDVVSLTVENGAVLEASFIEKELINESTAGIREFQLKVDFGEDNSVELKYKNSDGKIKAEIEVESEDGEEKVKGDAAVQELEAFLQEIAITPEMTKQQIAEKVLSALEADAGQIRELELEIKFSNGKKVEIELENDAEETEELYEEEETEEPSEEEQNEYDIESFKLQVELLDKQRLTVEYEEDDGEIEAKIQQGRDRTSGEEAVLAARELFEAISVSDEMSGDEIFESLLSYLEIEESDLKKLKVEIEFFSGDEIEFEFELEDEDDEDEDEDED